MDEPADARPYVAGSPLVRLFASPGRTRIVEAFLGKRGAELTAAEVAELAGVDPSTVSRNIDTLIDVGIVERRETPSGNLYRVDVDDPVVRELTAVRRELLGSLTDAESGNAGSEIERDPSSEAYVDRFGLVRLFGSRGQAKMVEAFLGKSGTELTGAEVAELAGIDRSTVSRNIGDLLNLGVIERTREVGSATVYRLVVDDSVVQKLGTVRREFLQYGTDDDDRCTDSNKSEVRVSLSEFDPDIVIDARDCILGRVASQVAERTLDGQKVAVVNAERAVITGDTEDVIERYPPSGRGTWRSRTYPPKRPDQLFKRSIRAMLPFEREEGRKALENVRVYIDNPFDDRNPKRLPNTSLEQCPNIRVVPLDEIAQGSTSRPTE